MAEEGCGQGEGTSSQPGPLIDNKASSNASVTRESLRALGGFQLGRQRQAAVSWSPSSPDPRGPDNHHLK